MARREVIGDCRLLLGRCEDILPTLGKVDAIVCDPPYGIGEAAGANASRARRTEEWRHARVTDYGNHGWDDEPLQKEVINLFRSVSRWQIIFGGNFYELPPSSCWLVWDKETSGDFADCELAWTNLSKAVRRLRYLWNGFSRREKDEPRVHPTQKPVGVMRWCISHLPADVTTICDPVMGSGSTGVAAVLERKRFIGIEEREPYFSHACRRIEAAYRQRDLFVDRPAPPKPVQMDLSA